MKYCPNCGQQIEDNAVFCSVCGKAVAPQNAAEVQNPVYNGSAPEPAKKTTIQIIAEVFMILGIISSCWLLVPLAWTIPMTVAVFRRHKRQEHIGTGLKVCILIFESLIAGILLLCDNND